MRNVVFLLIFMFLFIAVTVGAVGFPVNTTLYYVLKNNSTDTGVSPEILVVNNINLALKSLYNISSQYYLIINYSKNISCFLGFNNATLKVDLYKNNINTEFVILSPAVLLCEGVSQRDMAKINEAFTVITKRLNINWSHVYVREKPYYEGYRVSLNPHILGITNTSITLKFRGNLNLKTLSVYNSKTYIGDMPFIINEIPNALLLSYLSASVTHTSFESSCGYEGFSYIELVNNTLINKTYNVEGLGEIGYGRAVVSTPLVPYNKLVITGNSSSARGIVKRYLSTGVYYYKVEGGAWILTPKEYVWLERVLSRSPRYWVFHDSGCLKEESGPGGVRIKAYYPIVIIGNKSYMPWSEAPLLVYDSVTGALLEVGWPSGGNESSGILLLPPYVYGSLGGRVLGIASPTGLPGLELVRAVGLSKPSPGVLHSDYKRYSVAYQVSFLVLVFLLLAAVLGGWSTLPLRLIASLLVLGLVLLALTYGVVVPREQLSGVYGFNVGANGTLVFYGDRSKIININIEYSGNCTIPYNVSLVGPRGAESYVIVGNDTVLLPRLGDPGVYELVFRPAGNGSVNCSALELLRSSVDARVTVAVDKWRGYAYYLGYAVALLAASLLLLVYF